VRDGREILSSVVSSQVEVHHRYGGVVPELASRKHLEAITLVVREALDAAGLGLAAVEAVAVTQGPGLIGSLLVGFSFAKALAYAGNLPWVGVNHLEGHVHALYLSGDPPEFPFVVLLVSGGHTGLYHVSSPTRMQLIGQTRDDAAGEAFDKAARMLNLGYPGGPLVDACAQSATRAADPFTPPKFRDGKASWSFSGLKTGVKLRVERNPRLADAGASDPEVQGLCRSLQEAIATWLLKPLPGWAEATEARSLVISGGVACNSRLRAEAAGLAARTGLVLAIPEPRLCTDNGAMIAAAGALLEPEAEPLSQNADADLKLGA
jgi:N6-L-threonylcarbamoyladenine synthase